MAERSHEDRSGIVTKVSPRSVADTVSRLSEMVEAKGMKLFAVVDHSTAAASVGLPLRDTKVVLFGSPEAGTPVMEASPSWRSTFPSRSSCGATVTRPR